MSRRRGASERARRREEGTALLITVLLIVLMGFIGFAALQTVGRDQQSAGFQNRYKMALYAAEAGIAEAFERFTSTQTPSVSTTSLADSSAYPHGQPSYAPDPTVTDPIEPLGVGPFPGMAVNIGQNGGPVYQVSYWRIRVEGRAPGGSIARVEAATGALVSN